MDLNNSMKRRVTPWLRDSDMFNQKESIIFAGRMKKASLILLVATVLLSCTKKESTRTSGTDTIDNTTHFSVTYYNYGFSFSMAKLVSTESNPGPDITLYVVTENSASRLTLLANNLKPSFYKAGEYPDEATAKTAFDNLKTVSVTQWQDLADPILANQVWIYRSGTDTYTKFRIVSIINETRQSVPYGECTFQWVYQPDGTTTFPGK
jgi:hypothetical protein